LVINTQLSSPKLEVLQGVKDHDVLHVALQGQVVVVLRDGKVAGGLAAPDLKRLRECIEGGTAYIAVVTSVNHGQFKVRVSAAGS